MPRWLFQPVMVAAIAVFLTGCFISADPISEVEGDTQLGSYSLKWLASRGTPEPTALQQQLEAHIDQLGHELLPLTADGPLAVFNRLPPGACMSLPESVRQLLQYLQSFHVFSDTHTPEQTLLPWWLVSSAGTKQLSSEHSLMLSLESDEVCRHASVQLDLSSLVNSYVVDTLDSWLQQQGIQNYMLELAGDVRVRGKRAAGRPWKVVVEAPRDHARLAYRLLELDDHAVARAGDYRDYVARSRNQSTWLQGQVADSGQPGLRCVTVLAESATEADSLAHLLMFMGAEQGWLFAEEQGISAFFVEQHAENSFVSRGTQAFMALKNSEE